MKNLNIIIQYLIIEIMDLQNILNFYYITLKMVKMDLILVLKKMVLV